MSRKIRRHFTDDFKQQIVDLHNAGNENEVSLIKEYEVKRPQPSISGSDKPN